MTLAAAILAVLASLPRVYCAPGTSCPSDAVRATHDARVAYAVASASERATCTGPWALADKTVCTRLWPGEAPELAAALVTTGYFESRFSVAVAAGGCAPSGCGPRWWAAHSNWQIEQSAVVPRDVWERLVGLAPVPIEDAAWTAARIMALARGHCAPHSVHWVEPTLAGYATGNACRWKGARVRVGMVWSVLYRLRRMR